MPTLDPGSVIVAAVVAAAGAGAVTAAAARAWGTLRDAAFDLGERAASDPLGALAVALILYLAAGTAWAFAFAAAWTLTGWPIAPLQGALFALVPWAVGRLGPVERAIAPGDGHASRRGRDALARLASALTFGALVGLIYRPGS